MINFRENLTYILRKSVYLRCFEKADLYRRLKTRSQIEAYQLNLFNENWVRSFNNIPFFAAWKNEYHLPDAIRHLDELQEWPIMEKSIMRAEAPNLRWSKYKPDSLKKTGGSTGNPLHFGQFAYEEINYSANMWIGRLAYNYRPAEKCFLLWGHTHLLGTGWRRLVNTNLRHLKDFAMGFCRVSGYDYAIPTLRANFDKMMRFKPRAIICYSATGLAFMRANNDRKLEAHRLGLSTVICTAGPLSASERAELADFFNAPVCMEYGAAETGAMAYVNPLNGNYEVFWDDYIIEAQEVPNGYPRILVTSLMPKYLPLIRYDVGDLLERADDLSIRPLSFASVIGRPSESIQLSDGTEFWVVTIFDSVKQCPKIIAAQAVVFSKCLEIRVMVSATLTDSDVALMKSKCCSIVPSLNQTELKIVEVSDLERSLSGKVQLVLKKL